MCATTLLAGCATVGPSSIKAGRLAYSEAISTTGEEQLLAMILRERYDRTLTPLKVASITANVRFSASVGTNIGIGSSSAYEGNLVPLSAGVAYEENPIVSYTPVDSSAYLRQLLSPIPLDLALLTFRSSTSRRLLSLMLFERMNSLKNPNKARAGDSSSDFVRAVDLLTDLFQNDVAEFVALGENEFGLLLQVEEIREAELQSGLIELMRLLELSDLLREIVWTGDLPSGKIAGETGKASRGADSPDDSDGKKASDTEDKPEESGLAGADAAAVERSERDVLVISIRFSAVSDGSSLALTTRSVYDIMRIAAASVDAPPEDIERGHTDDNPFEGLTSDLISISRSEDRPEDVAIATRMNEWWYYIDPGDASSRRYFRAMYSLYAAQISAAEQPTGAPLLTVPVSR